MKNNLFYKKNFLLLVFILVVLFYSIFYNYYKFSPSNWLKFFPDTSALDKISTYSFWWFIISGDIYGNFMYIVPVIIVIISCYSFFEIYHTGFFQNVLQRTEYKKMMIKEILKCWKYSFIIPIFSLISLFISKILYKNNIITKYSDLEGYPIQIVNEQMEIMNPWLFIILHSILCVLFFIIVINVGIIFVRYLKKFYLVGVSSFIAIIFVENVNNIIIAPIVANITKIERMYNAFSLYNIYYLDAIPSLLWEFIFALLLVVLTTLFVLKIYKDKEKVFLDYE